MNGYDVTTTSYSFTNKPLTLTHVHTSGSKSLTEVHTYSYDYADRLSKVQHKLDNNTIVTLAEYTYDDLGRMEQKKLGGTAHSSTYSYNIRSWLTGIRVVSSPKRWPTITVPPATTATSPQWAGRQTVTVTAILSPTTA